jgi:phosphohistidine phosphatase SixA
MLARLRIGCDRSTSVASVRRTRFLLSTPGYGVQRVLTSPYVRCRQSVDPLGAVLELPVEDRFELAEGVDEADARALVGELADTTAVLCTHGDVLDHLLGEEPEKGSTWVVDASPDGGLRQRAYLPPPA